MIIYSEKIKQLPIAKKRGFINLTGHVTPLILTSFNYVVLNTVLLTLVNTDLVICIIVTNTFNSADK